MTIRIMELPMNEMLFQRLEEAARPSGIPVPEFVLQLLKQWFGERKVSELEQQELLAYKQMPVTTGEFDLWEAEQVWGEE